MQALPSGKAKNDKRASPKIAGRVRGGRLPLASGYPAERRATRDLLRRRGHCMRQRAELRAHSQTTTSQDHLPAIGKKVADKANREGVAEHCPEPSVRQTLAVELARSDPYDQGLGDRDLSIPRTAQGHAVQPCARRQSVPGSGKILALVLRSEIQDSARLPRVQDFVSYGRLVKGATESAGKRHGLSGQKIGTPQLQGAFSAAAGLGLRQHPPGKAYCAKRERQPGQGKALTVLAPKPARAVYSMLTRAHAFDLQRLVPASPLRGTREPAASLARSGRSLHAAHTMGGSTAIAHLALRPGAPRFDWPLVPAHPRWCSVLRGPGSAAPPPSP